MALFVRKNPASLAFATAIAFNEFKQQFVTAETTYPHFDITSVPSGSYDAPADSALSVVNSSTAALTNVQTMAEEIRTVLLKHFADVLAHKAVDSVDTTAIAVATIALLVPGTSSQGDTNTLLNALKLALNTHGASATYHPTVDGTNVIVAADASDLATSKVLAAAIRTAVNAHILFAWPTPSLNLVQD